LKRKRSGEGKEQSWREEWEVDSDEDDELEAIVLAEVDRRALSELVIEVLEEKNEAPQPVQPVAEA
jgi:hypothetical protein